MPICTSAWGARLERTRGPDEIPGSGRGYGTSLSYARELATYWKDEYDWRAKEARLNAVGQYTVPLKGINLHSIHERADGNDAVPILAPPRMAELGVGVPQDHPPTYGRR